MKRDLSQGASSPLRVNPSLNLLIRKGFGFFPRIWMRAFTVLSRKHMAGTVRRLPNRECRTPLSFVFSMFMKVCSDFKFALAIFQQGIHSKFHCKKDIVA